MKRALVFARVPMNVVCVKSICERLRGEIVFFGCAKTSGMRPAEVFEKAGLSLKIVPLFVAKLLRWDLYLSSDIYLAGKRSRIKIHTFHGISFKGRAYTEKVLEYDRLFIIGPYMLRRFVEKGILKEDDPRILKVGMPKLDALLDGTWTKENASAFLGLDPKRKTVLYAPSWGAASSLEPFGDIVVETVLNLGLQLVVKLHDHTLSDQKWRFKLSEWERKGAVVFKGFDVTPAMAAADLLISDASSVANEFLVLNRPIVYLYPPGLKKRYGETADFDMMFRAGLLVDSPEKKALEKSLIRSLERPEEFEAERLSLRSLLFYNLGRATEVAVNFIRELVL